MQHATVHMKLTSTVERRRYEQAVLKPYLAYTGTEHHTNSVMKQKLQEISKKLFSGKQEISREDLFKDAHYQSEKTAQARIEALDHFQSSLPLADQRVYTELSKHRKLLLKIKKSSDDVYVAAKVEKSPQSIIEQKTTCLKRQLLAVVHDFQRETPSASCYRTLRGDIAFNLPIEIEGHCFTLLISRDKQHTHSLRIFNKGKQPKCNPFLGNAPKRFLLTPRATYLLSEIEIRGVLPHVLLDVDFLSSLLLYELDNDSLSSFYQFLHEKTVVEGKGVVQLTTEEQRLLNRDLHTPRQKQLAKLLEKSPHIHRHPRHPTCYNTNQSSVERMLVPRFARKKEKLHRCQLAIEKLDCLPHKTDRILVIIELLKLRVLDLKQKISAHHSNKKSSGLSTLMPS